MGQGSVSLHSAPGPGHPRDVGKRVHVSSPRPSASTWVSRDTVESPQRHVARSCTSRLFRGEPAEAGGLPAPVAQVQGSGYGGVPPVRHLGLHLPSADLRSPSSFFLRCFKS